MGNPGGPSRGCQNCKRAHVKCDEDLPACSLCARRKLNCAYKNQFDLFHVDQTTSVKENWGKKRRRPRPKPMQRKGDLPIEQSSTSPTTESSSSSQRVNEQQRQTAPHQPLLSAPRKVVFDTERFALSHWFSRCVEFDINESSPQGFLQLQPQLYAVAKPNGALERATCAMAYLACSFNMERLEGRHPFYLMGRIAFGDAMRLVKEEIQDPEQSQSDEILMAGLILNMVESMLAAVDHRKPSSAHLTGALALIKLRGAKNFKNAVSQRMLTGVHSEIVGLALQRSVSVTTILAEATLNNSWMDDMRALPTTFSARLSFHAEQIASVQASVKITLNSWELLTEEKASELLSLLFEADQDLIAWEQDLPDAFMARPAADLSRDNLTKFEAYRNSLDTYADIWVANTRNSFRMLRIMLQSLIREILHRIAIDRPAALPFGPISYFHTTQRLVDEVCASVPFFMGTKRVGMSPEDMDFPYALGYPMTETQRVNNMRLGTWFIFAPLYACSRCLDLRPGQSDWIQKQIKRLEGLHFQLGGPHVLGWVGTRLLRILLRRLRHVLTCTCTTKALTGTRGLVMSSRESRHYP